MLPFHEAFAILALMAKNEMQKPTTTLPLCNYLLEYSIALTRLLCLYLISKNQLNIIVSVMLFCALFTASIAIVIEHIGFE